MEVVPREEWEPIGQMDYDLAIDDDRSASFYNGRTQVKKIIS